MPNLLKNRDGKLRVLPLKPPKIAELPKDNYFSGGLGLFILKTLTSTPVYLGVTDTTEPLKGLEAVSGNDLFYWPPGHTVKADQESEMVLFSPQREHSMAINYILEKVAQMHSNHPHL
jgi:hypothetical protein